MKAFIDRDALVKIIRDHTVFTTAVDIPSNWQWFQLKEGLLTWDFMLQGKVLVDVDIPVGSDVTPPQEWIQSFKVKLLEDQIDSLKNLVRELAYSLNDFVIEGKTDEPLRKIKKALDYVGRVNE